MTQEEAPKQTLITNVNLFDGIHEHLITGASILVEGNMMKQLPNGAIVAPGAPVIDGRRRTLIPGLSSAGVNANR